MDLGPEWEYWVRFGFCDAQESKETRAIAQRPN